jgi:protein-disulfide isomerase
MDDPTLDPDEAPSAGEEPVGSEIPTSQDSPAATQEPPARGGDVARVASLLGIGLLVGLGVGWVLFHEESGGGASQAAPTAAMGDGSRVESHGVEITNDPVLGRGDAPVTIVEFSDFDCPFCTRFATQTAPPLRRHYGDRVRWVFVNLPLQSIHPRAFDAALAGECAHAQNQFWPWYDAMFSGRFDSSESGLASAAQSIGLDTERFAQCVEDAEYASEVAADLREAEKFYILGTPTFFINGHRLEGAQPPEAFAAVIDSILGGS